VCGALTHVQSSAIRCDTACSVSTGMAQPSQLCFSTLCPRQPSTQCVHVFLSRTRVVQTFSALHRRECTFGGTRTICVRVRHVATRLTCVDGQRQHDRDTHLPALFLYTSNSQRSAWLLAPRPASCVCGCLLHTLNACQGVLQLTSGWWDRFCGWACARAPVAPTCCTLSFPIATPRAHIPSSSVL
jgi:hypothetical protein